MFNGLGSLYFKHGKIQGTFVDKFIQRGKLLLNNGEKYEGAFKNNRFEGTGTIRNKKGDRF
jgi:hypothetical protein